MATDSYTELRRCAEGVAETMRVHLHATNGNKITFPRREVEVLASYCETVLALPRRNCEVGTAEEQAERFDAFCVSHYTPPDENGVVPDGCDCPCYVRGKGCNAFAWEQLPYVEKEGGAE